MAQVIDGVQVPDWVNPAYVDSYVATAKAGNPRKPFQLEIAPAFGLDLSKEEDFAKATNIIYGVVGSNKDIRDWDAILASPNPSAAATEATKQMFDVITSGAAPELVGKTGSTVGQLQTNPAVEKITPLSNSQLIVVNKELVLKDPQGNLIAGITPQNAALYGVTQEQIDNFLNTSGLAANPLEREYVSRWKDVGYKPTQAATTSFLKSGSPTPIISQSVSTTQPTTTTASQQPTTATIAQPPAATQPQPVANVPTFPTPTAVPYGLPPAYTGSGYMPMFTGVMQQPQPQSIPSSVSMYGTLPFTYTPTTPYTVGAGGTAAPATIAPPQQTEVRIYRNASGLTTSITFVDGKPTTQIPSGFFPADQAPPVPQAPVPQAVSVPQSQTPTTYGPQFNMAVGGLMPSTQNIVSGFKPNAMQRIASSLGYTGDIADFNNYLTANPAAKQKYNEYMQAAERMARGGYVRKYQAGGDVQKDPRVLSQQYIPQQNFATGATLPQVQATIAKTPGLPTGATVVPTGTAVELGQLVSPASGQVSGSVALPTAQASTTAAAMPSEAPTAKVSTIESTQAVSATVDALQAAQGTLDPRAQVLAAQQTASSVGNVEAAQGNAILMTNPVQRQIQDGELIAPAANAETASKYTEQIEAATATPTKQATVQGQLEQLMAQFEGGKTPAWAAGSMRNAMATLAARGLGASSLAGQAVIQAAMEAALPIAQLDAQTQASFEAQNLSNRQQRAMLAAQQRAAFLGQEFDQTFQSRVANAAKISDIANMNFTAEQQVALENSRIANTMALQNLSNQQAVVLAEAAALANMDMANLNNRQQAAVMNAQNFLAVDMQNLSNQQQTDLFRAQSRIQALFTDQAAQNAAQQFNASSENQVNQFFASLRSQVGQFNATQANAQAQFNAGQINTIERFNAEINNQRDQFNAQNRLIIDQSNAQWRREISTAATAAVNRANELNATALVGLSQSAYNNLWQYYRDNMEWAWTSAENERQRVVNLAITQLQADASKDIQSMKQDYESSSAFGSLIGKLLTSDLTGSILGGVFG